MTEASGLSASRFYMWRAAFALAHADDVISPHEVAFLNQSTQDLPLSPGQREILKRDLMEEQDPAVMFDQVTDALDREHFMILARLLCWSDGDFDVQERKMMKILKQMKMEKDAENALEESKNRIQDLRLNKDQWDQPEERGFVAGVLKRLKG